MAKSDKLNQYTGFLLKLILGALGTSMTQRVSEQAKEKMDHLAFAIAENREQIGGIYRILLNFC